MTRFFVRRLLLIPLALLLVNFLGYSYAHYARPLRAARTPYSFASTEAQPLLPGYQAYLTNLLQGNLENRLSVPGSLRTGPKTTGETILNATKASMGLIGLAAALSIVTGLTMGLLAVKNDPPRVSKFLTLFTTIGLAMPSFYIGSLFILASVFYVLSVGPGTKMPFPLGGFGWDKHLVFPTLALMLRPTVQVAQMTATLLTTQLGEQYVVAARSYGHTWREIRNRYAFRNIIAPVILTIAGMLRLLVGEVILIEWLFTWPGLGRLLAWTLVPDQLSSSQGSPLFLNPEVMSMVLTVIAALFLLTDFAAAILVRVFDPRLRAAEAETALSVVRA